MDPLFAYLWTKENEGFWTTLANQLEEREEPFWSGISAEIRQVLQTVPKKCEKAQTSRSIDTEDLRDAKRQWATVFSARYAHLNALIHGSADTADPSKVSSKCVEFTSQIADVLGRGDFLEVCLMIRFNASCVRGSLCVKGETNRLRGRQVADMVNDSQRFKLGVRDLAYQQLLANERDTHAATVRAATFQSQMELLLKHYICRIEPRLQAMTQSSISTQFVPAARRTQVSVPCTLRPQVSLLGGSSHGGEQSSGEKLSDQQGAQVRGCVDLVGPADFVPGSEQAGQGSAVAVRCTHLPAFEARHFRLLPESRENAFGQHSHHSVVCFAFSGNFCENDE